MVLRVEINILGEAEELMDTKVLLKLLDVQLDHKDHRKRLGLMENQDKLDKMDNQGLPDKLIPEVLENEPGATGQDGQPGELGTSITNSPGSPRISRTPWTTETKRKKV
ncbi:hypothetical protein L3Y34_013642 [Caenorhabditis briggsae]|uniref:Uncharacterized protein n=1 Tax=Caenorhabditis briggsae TaxID=6238 RepID=A0AAE9A251_CAEBR|nr:hypothetical protein L3Y34_013642 [Caenorhabditis briggsae]